MEEIFEGCFAINCSSREIHSNETFGKKILMFRTGEYLYKSTLIKIRNIILKSVPQILSKNG